MNYIGKIDLRLFLEISDKIITDEVILTAKQRKHIEERHSKILEKYEEYFVQIIKDTDFILKDKTRENTAILIKTIIDKNNNILGNIILVLRLAVENDDINNKNSIITCIPIGRNRLKSYKNNGKIVYKKE